MQEEENTIPTTSSDSDEEAISSSKRYALIMLLLNYLAGSWIRPHQLALLLQILASLKFSIIGYYDVISISSMLAL